MIYPADGWLFFWLLITPLLPMVSTWEGGCNVQNQIPVYLQFLDDAVYGLDSGIRSSSTRFWTKACSMDWELRRLPAKDEGDYGFWLAKLWRASQIPTHHPLFTCLFACLHASLPACLPVAKPQWDQIRSMLEDSCSYWPWKSHLYRGVAVGRHQPEVGHVAVNKAVLGDSVVISDDQRLRLLLWLNYLIFTSVVTNMHTSMPIYCIHSCRYVCA